MTYLKAKSRIKSAFEAHKAQLETNRIVWEVFSRDRRANDYLNQQVPSYPGQSIDSYDRKTAKVLFSASGYTMDASDI